MTFALRISGDRVANVKSTPLGSAVPRTLPTLGRLARVCIEGPFDLSARQKIGQALGQHFLSVEQPADVEPWRSLLEKNSAGVLPSEIPVFLAQGTTDQIINPNVTRGYMNKLCNAGSKVKLMVLPDIGHGARCAGQHGNRRELDRRPICRRCGTG